MDIENHKWNLREKDEKFYEGREKKIEKKN